MQLITGPNALGLMFLLMCVCTRNGTAVRGRWEAGENIMENRPQSASGGGVSEIKTAGTRLLQMKGKRLQWIVSALQHCVFPINECRKNHFKKTKKKKNVKNISYAKVSG